MFMNEANKTNAIIQTCFNNKKMSTYGSCKFFNTHDI